MAGICVAASIFRIPDDFTCLRCANDELTALLSRIGALLSLSASEFEVVDDSRKRCFALLRLSVAGIEQTFFDCLDSGSPAGSCYPPEPIFGP